jgi:hypothetical protein
MTIYFCRRALAVAGLGITSARAYAAREQAARSFGRSL